MRFEILPAFRDIYSIFDGNRVYKYPDANMGGNWRATNPKAEQEAMRKKNQESNGLLYDTCKHMRKIRDNHFSSYHLSGIVIDSFVYAAMKDWRWLNSGETSTSQPGTYEQVLLDYLNNHFPYWAPQTITAPGSEQIVDINGSLECLTKVMMFIAE